MLFLFWLIICLIAGWYMYRPHAAEKDLARYLFAEFFNESIYKAVLQSIRDDFISIFWGKRALAGHSIIMFSAFSLLSTNTDLIWQAPIGIWIFLLIFNFLFGSAVAMIGHFAHSTYAGFKLTWRIEKVAEAYQ